MKKGLHHLSRAEKMVVQSFVEELRNRLGNEVIKIILFGSKIRGDFIMSRLNLARYRMEKAGEILKNVEDAVQRGRLMLSVHTMIYCKMTMLADFSRNQPLNAEPLPRLTC